jgi:hypothetical protein
MLRAACAAVGLVAVMAPSARQDVDAVVFATAFRAGNADQYKNKQVTGTGVNFHGAIRERIADGSTRTSLVMTLGSAAPDGKIALLKTWDEFVGAERARTTLVVALSGPDLPTPSATGPSSYEFTGVYDGQVRTIMRAPQSGDVTPADRPCPGEQPAQGEVAAAFHCAPLLTGAKVTGARSKN